MLRDAATETVIGYQLSVISPDQTIGFGVDAHCADMVTDVRWEVCPSVPTDN
jgi:hypothetical protein